ncbi:hypothetical protein ACIPRI_19700 [Variovorax sp. LARHSF232]
MPDEPATGLTRDRLLRSPLLLHSLAHAAEANPRVHHLLAVLYRCERPNAYLYEESLRGRVLTTVERGCPPGCAGGRQRHADRLQGRGRALAGELGIGATPFRWQHRRCLGVRHIPALRTVVVDTGPILVQRLSGTVLGVNASRATVSASGAADNPCAVAPGAVDMAIDATTRFMTVIVTDTSSTTRVGGTLAAGQSVDAYGTCTAASAFDAQQVVIIDDRRTP